jgi:ABC-type uncharacterized transport system substrate-binding protein
MHSFNQTYIAAAAIALISPSSPASAHPHAWITARAVVELKQGQVVALQHQWTFDEMYATDATAGLDTNKDGKFDKDELQPLAQTNMDGVKEYNYFTTATVAGKAVEFGAPADYWLEFTNGLLTLHFTLPLAQPIPAKGDVMKFSVEDPTFYIAFDFAKDDPIKLAGSMLSGCKAEPSVAPVAEDQQKLSDAFAAQFDPSGGGDSANTIAVTCPQ